MNSNQIKRAFKKVVNLASTVANVLADGKVTGSEWVTLALTSPTIPGIIEDAKKALKANAKLTPELSAEIAQEFAVQFDIKNDELESNIEEAIAILANTHKVANDAMQVYDQWESWVEKIRA